MLVECGFARVTTSEGEEYTFTPSLGRIADMGSPRELVELYAAVHGDNAAPYARYVLACLCDQPDPLPLIGGVHIDPKTLSEPPRVIPARMPEAEQIVIARHLLQHGMVGKAKPGARRKSEQGQYAQAFDAAEYISAARVHLGLSSADAEALSMSEFQQMFAMKFPEAGAKAADIPTREEYMAAMEHFRQRAEAQGDERG